LRLRRKQNQVRIMLPEGFGDNNEHFQPARRDKRNVGKVNYDVPVPRHHGGPELGFDLVDALCVQAPAQLHARYVFDQRNFDFHLRFSYLSGAICPCHRLPCKHQATAPYLYSKLASILDVDGEDTEAASEAETEESARAEL